MEILNGKDLKTWRKNNHLTQKQLAESTGYSISSLSHLESSGDPVSDRLQKALAELDANLNPSDAPLKQACAALADFNSKTNNIFRKEISVTEDLLAELIHQIPCDFYSTVPYLAVTNVWLSALLEILTTDHSDQDAFRKMLSGLKRDTEKHLQALSRSGRRGRRML